MKLALLAAAVLIAATSAVASTADDRPFLLHVNANTSDSNCGYSEWSGPSVQCMGNAAPSGNSYTFSQQGIIVQWCDAKQNGCDVGKGYTMPAGYVRWMYIGLWSPGTLPPQQVRNWLLGAVQMPNGPFHVMAGKIDNNPVQPDNGDQGKIGKTGGPLALIVRYTGQVSGRSGEGPTNGYTIGLVGRIKF